MTDPAAKVLWLASYPKTGSTWVRTILGCLLAPKLSAFDAVRSFQSKYPPDAPAYTIWGQRLHVLKTHLTPDHPRMANCPGATAGVIVVDRHPLDILLSALNYAAVKEYALSFLNETIKPVEQIVADGEFGHYIDQFIAEDGFPRFFSVSEGYSTYLSRWRSAQAGQPFHAIRYETMFNDPGAEVQRLAEFIGKPIDRAGIETILDKVDLTTKANGRFYWKRRANNYREMLTPDLIDRFEAGYSGQLAAHGYL